MKNEHLFQAKAKLILEALSSIPNFVGETFVIKYGGIAMSNEDLLNAFVHNIVLLKQLGINPIIIHDGEHEVGLILKMLGMDDKFINNIRLTDKDTIKIVEMTMCGSVNKKIVQHINSAGGSAIGLCGKDGNLMYVEKITTTVKENRLSNIEKVLDIGFIGRPVAINPDILFLLEESEFIPVIAPLGCDRDGETYSVSAESAASAIAITLSASKVIIFSDTDEEINSIGHSKISVKNLNASISNKKIQGERITKMLIACTKIVEECSSVVHIVDGRVPNVILDLFIENNSNVSIVAE